MSLGEKLQKPQIEEVMESIVEPDGMLDYSRCDKRVASYSMSDGRSLQHFDYNGDPKESAFNVAAVSPSGQSVVLGSFDRLRLFNWNTKRGAWDEGPLKEIQYLYTISALAWKPDGSRLACGTLCGSVIMFDCATKRSMLNKKFETTFVGPSQLIIRNISTGSRAVVRSKFGNEIAHDEVKVMGQERYVIAKTPQSILLADMESGACSEIPWTFSGNERYYFDVDNVCMIFNAGELSLVEYGVDELIGSVRTEFMNPHLISVSMNSRGTFYKNETSRRLAYLIDAKTINIVELAYNTNVSQISHDSKIDWLELNETGKKLLFRDKRYRLHMNDIENDQTHTLVPFCSYTQWVPGSDVMVAQHRDNLCIWYNANYPDRVTTVQIKGDVIDLRRVDGVTDVIVQEGNQQAAYQLDEGLIEFGTAMDDMDLARAVAYLEQIDADAPEAAVMWRQLAHKAVQLGHLHAAKRAYAALCDIARVRYLEDTIKLADQSAKINGGDGTDSYQVRARLAIMRRDFADAERIYLERNALDEAVEMYQGLHKWDAAMELAQARGHPDLAGLKAKYERHLAATGQDERAAEIKEAEGDVMGAIDMYLNANLPVRAAKVVTGHESTMQNTELVQSIAITLIKAQLYDKAGELLEKSKDFKRALECYRQGKAYAKAVEMCRYAMPEEVIKLEHEWGEHLVADNQPDAAINHFIESGASILALDAAVKARQWEKAASIVDSLPDATQAIEYFPVLAKHFADVGDYERAERYYVEAGQQKEAMAMYNTAGKWDDAKRLAKDYLGSDETQEMYSKQALQMETEGRYAEAEKLYIAGDQPNKAMAMYKAVGRYDDLMRLVKQFHPEHAQETYLHLGNELERQGRLREAEGMFVQAQDWKTAANMYRNADQWEDAHRVAKMHGGDQPAKQVAFLWAKSLGGESAVKLLQRLNLLEPAIDYACDTGAFDFAFELCRIGVPGKMQSVHLKYALQLEEDGQLDGAEQQYLRAEKPKEAVHMYVHQQDWDNAQRLAEKHATDLIPEVYIGHAQIAFEQGDYAKAERFLLRAQKPEIAVKSYKDLGMWSDAMRVCKDYIPNLLPQLQQEFDKQQLKSGAKGAQSYVAQAKDWEQQGEYDKAIACYLKVEKSLTNDENLMERCWVKAGELAEKFLPEEPATSVCKQAAEQLIDIGRYAQAAELLLSVGLFREAIDALITALEWSKAKKVASELQPELQSYVDEKYKEHLRSAGNTEQLASVDVIGAIDMLVEKDQWDKALVMAKQHGQAVLDKYVAQRAAQLLEDDAHAALKLFEEHGAAANGQNFNLYKRLIDSVVAIHNTNGQDGYDLWAGLRNVLLSLTKNIALSENRDLDPRYLEIFSRYLDIAHYCALRSAFTKASASGEGSAKLCATKISISLLRNCDLIAADKLFYEAGVACREQGGEPYESMAFIFLNHYLDLADAIEDQSPEQIDNKLFERTDIPSEFPLPENLYLQVDEHEEVKEWVLAKSVDASGDRTLPTDARGSYEASLLAAGDSAQTNYQPCIITGYPVLDGGKAFKPSDKLANRDDWNRFLLVYKKTTLDQLSDVQKFITQWTGSVISMAM